jgi:hypothetical protein
MRLRFFGRHAVRVADEASTGAKIFSQPELRSPSFAAQIKGAEELLRDRPAYLKFWQQGHTPDPRIEALTAEMIARGEGGAREFRSNATEIIPKEYSIADILEGNRKLWQQGPIAPAVANVMEGDLLRAMNKRNRDFWGAR